MKVTNEMVQRAYHAYQASIERGDPLWSIRLALEAALDDLPDLEDLPALVGVAEARLADVRRQLVRLGHALAQLNDEES